MGFETFSLKNLPKLITRKTKFIRLDLGLSDINYLVALIINASLFPKWFPCHKARLDSLRIHAELRM